LRELINGSTPSPALEVGDSIRVKEGVSNSALQELEQELSNHGGAWDVLIPIIPAGSHTGWKEVLGFAAIRLTLVDSHGGDKRIEAETLEDYVAPGTTPGGPTYYGLRSAAPKLVQ
jgi:hypothetical protein